MAPADKRFARLSTDPRFIRPSKASQKVVLDDRFKNLLSSDADYAGESAAKVDKYGRKVAKNKGKKDLKAFYRLDDARAKGVDLARGEGLIESSSEEEQDEEEEDEDEDSEEEEASSAKAARSARASSEVSVDLDEDEPVASTSAGTNAVQVEEAIPMMQNTTARIALVNMDWDNVRAIDLYKVFDSVLSSSASAITEGAGSRKSKTKIGKGRVESVKIFPSEFGRSRLAREEVEGPPIEIFNKKKSKTLEAQSRSNKGKKASRKQKDEEFYEDDSADEDDGEDYDEEALRRYQLERLRYYYAVVEFDNAAAAQHAYEEIDGTEFEATANIFDLRYVPDETTFDDDATDVATASSVQMQAYKPADFVTDALRNSKVKLTWDADDPERMKLTKASHQRGGKEDDVDYSALLASDSEDESERRDRLRSAFGFDADGGLPGMDEEDEEQEMEVTFAPALSGKAGDGAEDATGDETSLEAYQRKERERRQAKKEKRKAEKRKEAGSGKMRMVYDEEEDSDPDEAFDANQMEADGDEDEEGGDGFFAFDGQEDAVSEEEEEDETAQKLSKKAAKQLERQKQDKEAEALSLLMDDGDGGSDDGKHFDMQAILRAEKIGGKPKKSLKKGKDRRKHKEATELLAKEKDKFEVDLKDDRFKRIHEDHEFALDPSNAKFMKTKNMQRLLEENRRRRSEQAPDESVQRTTSASTTSNGNAGLTSLVESIKRKSKNAGDKSKGNKKQKRA